MPDTDAPPARAATPAFTATGGAGGAAAEATPGRVGTEVRTTTFAQAGKSVRMRRIFGSDGRCVVVPLDHGTILGRLAGLEDPLEVLRRFLSGPVDGFLLGPGLLRRSAGLFAHRGAPARVMTLDVYWRDETGAAHRLAADLASAAALGVDAVKLLMPWDCPATERAATAALVASVVEQAEPLGLPVMVEPVALETEGARAVEVAAHGSRVAVELGADIVKLGHPGDPEVLASWCTELGVPVVILGGGGDVEPAQLARTVRSAVAVGASGIVIGRKLWGRPAGEALALLVELHALVHAYPADEADVKGAAPNHPG